MTIWHGGHHQELSNQGDQASEFQQGNETDIYETEIIDSLKVLERPKVPQEPDGRQGVYPAGEGGREKPRETKPSCLSFEDSSGLKIGWFTAPAEGKLFTWLRV